jgi:dihydrofolate reductase
MRKIIVISMITLDGVMQAPGGPEEDTSNGFKYGGWTAQYLDEVYGKVVEKGLKPADYLLGRKTFKIWENYWPAMQTFGQVSTMARNTSCPRPEKDGLEKLSFPERSNQYQKAQKLKKFRIFGYVSVSIK